MSIKARWDCWRTPSRCLRIVCMVVLAVAFVRSLLPIPDPGPTPSTEAVITHVAVGVDKQTLRLDNHLIATVPRYPQWHYGDRIRLSCTPERPESFDGFAYDRYLAAKGIYWTCFARSAPQLISSGHGNGIMYRLQIVRSSLVGQIDLVFGEPQSALLAGLLFGEKRFSDDWQEAFVRTGTSHIVAASGYNVAMLGNILGLGLAFFGLRRRRAFTFLFAGIIGYMLFAALETAVVRAAVMAMLVLCSQQLGRSTTMTNALLVTASIMLTLNPRLLFDDVAFLLSFLSTIGLIYLAPRWQQRWKWIPEVVGIRASLVCTLAATLMSLPVILFSFGQLSLSSVLTNVLILPVVPFVMADGALATLVSWISMDLARLLALPATAGLNWMFWVVQSIAALPLSLPVPWFAAVVMFIPWAYVIKELWRSNVLRSSWALFSV